MKYILPGEYTSLNDYVDAERGNRFKAAKIKERETLRAKSDFLETGLVPVIHYPVVIHFSWYTADKRTDSDNVAFAKKFILDGMVLAGVLKNDSRKFVVGTSDMCFVDKRNPRVEIEVEVV